jgi:multiple sugar transport system substrate-binding protein/sn-glycerol 3-phosphate transport system substrate-binding protein
MIYVFLLVFFFLFCTACQVERTEHDEPIKPVDTVLSNQMQVEIENTHTPASTPGQMIPSTPGPTLEDPWAAVDPSGQNILLWHGFSGENRSTFDSFVADFNKTNEWGITVEAQSQDNMGEIFNQMLAVINTPDAPNIVTAYQDQSAVYHLYNGLADLSVLELSPRWGLPEDGKSDFFKVSLQGDISPLADKKRLGFPFSNSMQVLYYNKEWLAELGYSEPPETPQEFKEIACKAAEQPFSKTEEEQGIGYGFWIGASRFASWTFSHNGDVFDYDNEEYSFDNEASIQAMRYLQDLILRGCAVTFTKNYEDQAQFGKGNVLFTSGTSAGFHFYEREIDQDVQFELGVAPIPFTTAAPIQNVHNISFSIPSANREAELASWLFLKHLTSPEIQAEWVKSSSYFPVRISAASGLVDYFIENPNISSVFALLDNGKVEPAVPGYEFVRELVSEAMSAIFIGEDAETVLTELTDEANTILEDQLVIPLSTFEAIPVNGVNE